MDGELSPIVRPDLAPAARVSRPPPSRVRRTVWFVGVLVLAALVLGGLSLAIYLSGAGYLALYL